MIGRNINSAYGFRAKIAQVDFTPETEMWQSWFMGSDGIGFGLIKRWNGTTWVISNNLKVHAF